MTSVWIIIFSCSDKENVAVPTPEPETIEEEPDDTADSESTIPTDGFLMVEKLNENQGQLVLRNEESWADAVWIQDASPNARLRKKNGYIWLLNRGNPESVVQYDPMDLSQPRATHTIEETNPMHPNDVAICGERVFVTMYHANHILVLDPENLDEVDRIPLDSYADNDGFSEPSSLVCKNKLLYVAITRFNRDEQPNGMLEPQSGSVWAVFNPETLSEETSFDGGYRSQMIDIPETKYIGNAASPHPDIAYTTGFWVYDTEEDTTRSQIYWALNDKTIFDSAVGTAYAAHLATNYYDGQSWLFCHDLSPQENRDGNLYNELVPVTHAFVSIAMSDEDAVWVSFRQQDEDRFFYMSVDPSTCLATSNEQSTPHLIVDWEIIAAP